MSFVRTLEELMAEMEGLTLEEHREQVVLRERLTKRGEQYRRALPDKWPALTFNWDLRPESQRFSLDGMKQAEFDKLYPNGFILGHVEVSNFDEKLCNFNRRNDLQELWDCGSESSLCYMLTYLEEGFPISPVLVAVTPYNELCLHGGNHRYTAAKFSGQEMIPIYAEPDNQLTIQSLVSVTWADIYRTGELYQ